MAKGELAKLNEHQTLKCGVCLTPREMNTLILCESMVNV